MKLVGKHWATILAAVITAVLALTLGPVTTAWSAEVGATSTGSPPLSPPLSQPLKKKPARRIAPKLVTIPPGVVDPTEPRPIAAPIDPVVSLRLLEAEIRSSDAQRLPGLIPPPHFVVESNPALPAITPSPAQPDQKRGEMALATEPASDQNKKFVPSFELISLWVNLRATDALGDMSRAMVLQKWQELTADRTLSKKDQRGFQSLLNVTAVLVDGRDHRLALETLRQRSRVWMAVQNGFDFMSLPQDSENIIVAIEQQNPNYRAPTRYDDLRGVLLLQGLVCPLVTRFIKLAEGDWLVSCNNSHRYRITQAVTGQILAVPYEWRE